MNKLVVAYLRLSKEDEHNRESNSIKNQKEIIREYAKNNNLNIVKFYIDDGYSGGNFERPGFKEMIDEINNISTIITKDISRLGRDFIETSYYIFKFFPEKKIRYIAILENYDSLKPNGIEDLIPFQAVVNDMYLKDISKKIISARHSKMKNGQYVGSTVPYGYKRNQKDKYKFVIDEYAAKIVRKIFNMKLCGQSSLSIAKILTFKNILPPSVYNKRNIAITEEASKWNPSTIDNILKNEIYIGKLVQAKYSNINYKSRKKILLSKDKWIIYENFTEPIINKEIFYKVQNIKEKSKGLRNSKYNYMFKGMVFCKECNKAMTIRTRKKKIGYYACKSNLKYGKNICTFHYFLENKLNNIIYIVLEKELCVLEDSLRKYIYSSSNELNEEIIKKLIDKIYIDKNKNIELYFNFLCFI